MGWSMVGVAPDVAAELLAAAKPAPSQISTSVGCCVCKVMPTYSTPISIMCTSTVNTAGTMLGRTCV